MTVAELIAALQQLPQDHQVVVPDEFDYRRAATVGTIRVASSRIDGGGASGARGRLEAVEAVALNFDPGDLA